MEYFVIAILGFVGGGICVFIALDKQRKRVATLKYQSDAIAKEIDDKMRAIEDRGRAIDAKQEDLSATILQRENELKQNAARLQATYDAEVSNLTLAKQQFNSRFVAYGELEEENRILKQDLRNVNVNLRKLQLDGQQLEQSQATINEKVKELGSRYLKENVKWIGNSINANNFASCKQRLLDVIERCRGIGFEIPQQEEEAYVADLRAEYERVVRAAYEREEQARIKAQIREEAQREREIQRELERVERERAVIQAALTKALAEAHDEHSAEIEALKARLAEAEEKERAISQAQLTKAGFVYVISNIGSLGEGVYKIGMTRRLVPEDRVRELGDASVPFPFDIHMLISCEDAPALENAIHRKLLKQQVNKTNPRKEFFRTDIESIVEVVREHHGEVQYTADAEALQYRQSLTMSDEDQEFIEHVFDEVEEEMPAESLE